MIEWIIGAVVGKGLYDSAKREKDRKEKARLQREENERREKTYCGFDDGISYEEFKEMTYRAANRIKRITGISVDGPFIYCDVRSQSGLSSWEFEVDFNDWGHITGHYWWRQDNDDSDIPEIFANIIKEEINNYMVRDECYNEKRLGLINSKNYCFNCGANRSPGATFCYKCGIRFD